MLLRTIIPADVTILAYMKSRRLLLLLPALSSDAMIILLLVRYPILLRLDGVSLHNCAVSMRVLALRLALSTSRVGKQLLHLLVAVNVHCVLE